MHSVFYAYMCGMLLLYLYLRCDFYDSLKSIFNAVLNKEKHNPNTNIYEKTFIISLVRGFGVGIGANGEKSPVNKGRERQRHLSV